MAPTPVGTARDSRLPAMHRTIPNQEGLSHISHVSPLLSKTFYDGLSLEPNSTVYEKYAVFLYGFKRQIDTEFSRNITTM